MAPVPAPRAQVLRAGPRGLRACTAAFGGVVGIAICNDRRWPETYRVLGLQGVELRAASATTRRSTTRPTPTRTASPAFHNNLVMAAGAYQNGTWVVGVAKGGVEEGVERPAPTARSSRPSGEVVARAATEGDEVVVAACDLDLCLDYKRTVFDFERYRRPEMYTRITVATRRGRPPSDES